MEARRSEEGKNASREALVGSQNPINEQRDEILELGSSSDSDVEVVSVRRPRKRVVVDLANGSESDGENAL